MLQLWKYTKYDVDSYVAVSYGILIVVERGEASQIKDRAAE